ncbi:MAG: hypothetical protein Q4B26_11055 [Eubacteriales bacterium]|nr:hypothetical protein [Eubacteriales bacterium]
MSSRQYKHARNNYDQILLNVPKGKKAVLKELANKAGLSLNSYINKILFDQFDEMLKRMQIAEKYRPMIKIITGNSKNGYKVELNEGYIYANGDSSFTCKDKSTIRKEIKKCHIYDG